jgi:hypothetical protein
MSWSGGKIARESHSKGYATTNSYLILSDCESLSFQQIVKPAPPPVVNQQIVPD